VTLDQACKALMLSILVFCAAAGGAEETATNRWYTFSWPLDGADSARAPRGGTTRGPEVLPAAEPAEAWTALKAPGLTGQARDRLAILALAGEFRTSFDFVETLTYVPDLARARPYQSWATEYVFVIEDQPDFISLQHLLVMSFVEEDGALRGPFVQKHWRQDWRYEAPTSLAFLGNGRWTVRGQAPVRGSWTQTVHQVDDTPRYAATGQWTHSGGVSIWEADRAWRPIPRRERTVRDDYDVLLSQHRISITPRGWTHEQDNLKGVLGDGGILDRANPYLAREQGVSQYQRITGYDFEAGRSYWARTAAYWGLVRAWWQAHLASEGTFSLRGRVNGEPLFVPLFTYAEHLEAQGDFDPDAARAFIEDTMAEYIGTD
jgi:hypothetical protein